MLPAWVDLGPQHRPVGFLLGCNIAYLSLKRWAETVPTVWAETVPTQSGLKQCPHLDIETIWAETVPRAGTLPAFDQIVLFAMAQVRIIFV